MSEAIRHSGRINRATCTCGMSIFFKGEYAISCPRCGTAHLRGNDLERSLPRHEGEIALRFVMLGGSHVELSGGDLGMFTMRRHLRFACTVPLCEWKGGEEKMRAHYEWHRLLAPRPEVKPDTSIPISER